MMRFKDWISVRESSASTRARSAAARGLMPLATVGSVHGHSTANPWEAEQIKKAMAKAKKHKKKSTFGASPSKKKIGVDNHNLEIDRWMKEVGDLKDDLKKLKVILDKKKAEKDKPEAKKPEIKKPDSSKNDDAGKKPDKKNPDDLKKPKVVDKKNPDPPKKPKVEEESDE